MKTLEARFIFSCIQSFFLMVFEKIYLDLDVGIELLYYGGVERFGFCSILR